jgi:anti-sigma-K factor RskA
MVMAMDLRKGRVLRPLPRWSVAGYAVSYTVWVAAGIALFVRVARGHTPGLLVIVALAASSILGVAIGFLDVRAGRVELPPGFVEMLGRLRRR